MQLTEQTTHATRRTGIVVSGPVTDAQILKFDSSVQDGVAPATGSTAAFAGVAHGAASTGQPITVMSAPCIRVLYSGGAITRGQQLTSDSQGRAVVAAPGAGVVAYIIGTALDTVSGADLPVRVEFARPGSRITG